MEKYCKNCKWFSPDGNFNNREYRLEYANCMHTDSSMGIDLVTGEPLGQYLCKTARKWDHMCGLSGKWFESKNAEGMVKYTVTEDITVTWVGKKVTWIKRLFGG